MLRSAAILEALNALEKLSTVAPCHVFLTTLGKVCSYLLSDYIHFYC